MQHMFYDAYAFNQPLNQWNVASVTDHGGDVLFVVLLH
jgi:surface protein